MLPLPAILIELSFHLALKLFRLAMQHLLLPLLLGGLGAVALLLGQLLLTLRQFIQLFQNIVNFLRLLFRLEAADCWVSY